MLIYMWKTHSGDNLDILGYIGYNIMASLSSGGENIVKFIVVRKLGSSVEEQKKKKHFPYKQD